MGAALILGQTAAGDPVIITVDAAGHLQIDVLSVALPTGAATLAEQQTQTTALQLIDDLRNALGSVNTDDLQVDVKTSALPTGAATEAKQDTQITALQLIDDLRNALASVATDKVRVAEMRDRNPTKIHQVYRAGAIAPHGATVRWTYTVPASRMALVEMVSLIILRDAAPTTASYGLVYLSYFPSGGSAQFATEVIEITATVGVPQQVLIGQGMLLKAGDALSGNTNDLSTGGTYFYEVTMVATEFDA